MNVFYVYLFSALVGGALLLYSVAGGIDSADGDAHIGDAHEHGASEWLSIRTITYFLFVFGGVGAVLSKALPSAFRFLAAGIATLSGLFVAGLVAAVFRYLNRTSSGAHLGDESFVGLTGTMSLPIGGAGIGKVRVQLADRMYELLASPLNDAGRNSSDWRSVIVVEMRKGTAIVAPLDATEVSSLTQP